MTARVLDIGAVDVRHAPDFVWDFARQRAVEIDAHWRGLVAARPQMFDGRVLLMRDARVSGDRLEAKAFVTHFRNFQAWKDFGFADPDIVNIFAMAALRSQDGFWMMGRMGAHTSNAGQVYFPAGTPDLDDLRDGSVDLAGSVWRELAEETGLTKADCTARAGWRLVFGKGQIACMKILDCPAPASDVIPGVRNFLTRDADPELQDFVAVRDEAELGDAPAPDFIRSFLRAAVA